MASRGQLECSAKQGSPKPEGEDSGEDPPTLKSAIGIKRGKIIQAMEKEVEFSEFLGVTSRRGSLELFIEKIRST